MGDTKPILTNSPTFEYVYVTNQRCDCGGHFAVLKQQLGVTPSGPVDQITAHCEACNTERTFVFDISSFFGDFEKYNRFHQVDEQFRAGMDHLRANRPAEAEAALRAVVDPEEGEPFFAWGHYHLGLLLAMTRRLDQALVHLEQAADIQPREPKIHEALGRALQAAGREAEGKEHLHRAEVLRASFHSPENRNDSSKT